MNFIFRNRTIFWDISKWNKGKKKWEGGSIIFACVCFGCCFGLIFATALIFFFQLLKILIILLKGQSLILLNKLLKIIYYIHVQNLNKKNLREATARPRITPSLFAMWDSCNKMCVKALFAQWDNCNKMCVKACDSLIWYYY